MRDWVRWAAPPAIVVSIAGPAYSAQYLTIEQAQALAFPTATRFVEAHVVFQPSDVAAIERRSGQKVRARGQQVWQALVEDHLVGFFIVDYVIFNYLVIDYGVALYSDGRLWLPDILQ